MRSAQLDILRFESQIGDDRLRISDERLGSLIKKSVKRSGASPEPTARSFSDWIFSLEHGKYFGSPPSKLSRIAEVRRTIANVLDRNGDAEIGEWELVSYDDGSGNTSIYKSSVLTLSDRPLRMKPDVVWRNRETGIIAIFEYKVASDWVHVPEKGWPNLAAQLWAYAWADEWKDERDVILLGAIFKGESAQLAKVVPRTVKSDSGLNHACATLFRKWGGQIHSSKVAKSCRVLIE
jgi:hypothetical protein